MKNAAHRPHSDTTVLPETKDIRFKFFVKGEGQFGGE
jgi:hypothetical protein